MNKKKKVQSIIIFAVFALVSIFTPYSHIGVLAAEQEETKKTTEASAVQDSFTWQKYSHYFTDIAYKGTQTPSGITNDHIVLNGNVMTFYGYAVQPFNDYMFMSVNDSSKKTFSFNLDEAGINYHSMVGGGFLFNGKIVNGILTSYMILFENGGLGLYKVGPVNATSFNEGTFTTTKITTFKKNGSSHNIKLEVEANILNLWDNNVQTVTNYKLSENIGDGFGPIAVYAQHNCGILSYFTFGNLKMEIGGQEITIIPIPKNLKAISNVPYQIDISWDAAKDAKSYDLELDGVVVNVGLNTSYAHKNLLPGSSHSYRVRAVCEAGIGEWSEQANAIALGNPDTWTTEKSVYMPITNSFTTSVNGKIYVLGGTTTSGNSLKSIEVYDPLNKSWSIDGNMTDERLGMTGVSVQNSVYVFGGKKNSEVLNISEIYNVKAKSWTKVANMPTARYGMAAAYVNGKVYVIGGYNGKQYLNTVEEYDPQADKWVTKEKMPTARSITDVAVVNGIIYVIGGYNGKYLNVVECYDSATDTWQKKSDMPTPRRSLGVEAVNGLIYAVGGLNTSGELNKLEVYNPSNDTWTSKKDMPTPRAYLGFESVYNLIFAIGGTQDGIATKVLEMYNP